MKNRYELSEDWEKIPILQGMFQNRSSGKVLEFAIGVTPPQKNEGITVEPGEKIKFGVGGDEFLWVRTIKGAGVLTIATLLNEPPEESIMPFFI